MPRLLPVAKSAAAPVSQSGSLPAGGRDEARKRLRAQQAEASQAGGSADRPRGRKENLHNERTAGVLQTIVKGTLRNMQDLRDMHNCIVDVFLGPSEDPIFSTMKDQTIAYSQLPQREREGPPHIVAFLGLLTALTQKGVAVGAANLQALENYLKETEGMDTEQMAEAVRHCRQVKCYQASQTRLVLEISRTPVRRQLIDALKQAGFKWCVGRAPAGHLERELQNWLDAL